MPALIQDRKHTCKTLEYQSLSLWCHRQLGQLVLHVLHARAAWIGVLPCTFVLMPIVCKRRGSVLMGHKVPPTKPRVPPGPGEVELGPVGYRYGSWGQSAPLRCSCAVGKHGTREATPTRKTGASRIGSDGPKLTSCFCKESTDHLAISVCMLK